MVEITDRTSTKYINTASVKYIELVDFGPERSGLQNTIYQLVLNYDGGNLILAFDTEQARTDAIASLNA